MLLVSYSNRLDKLVAALLDALESARSDPPDIFTSTTIIVPNHSVATYIKVAAARRMGVAANLSFPFLDTFLSNCVAHPERRPLDRGKLHALLVGELEDQTMLAEPLMAPVRDYLYASGDQAEAVELRRFQLAGELAALFTAYATNRPGLTDNWHRGLQLAETSFAGTEQWQRRLWLRLFGKNGPLARAKDRDGTDWRLLPSLLKRARHADLVLPKQTIVFGFSYVAPAYMQMLVRLAEVTDIQLFALNPSQEYWEDLDHNADVSDAPLLRRWGKPGRVNVRDINAITNHTFSGDFIDPTDAGADHLLARVQSDALTRAPIDIEAAKPKATNSESIQFLACPNPQRELEIIGNTIWDLVLANDDLRFNDIAVLVAADQQESYQAHVAAVFRELHDIPYHVVDQSLSSESRIVEAFDLLLDLPMGTFARPELLRLLSHPAVLARYPDVDADDWVHWAERLGIVHGADHSDHAETYIERDLFNWDQGIRRLALGAFMDDAEGGVAKAVEFGGAAYMPEHLRQESLPSAARFCLLARSLINDARFSRDRMLPLHQWREFIDLYATSYLTPVGDDDERNFGRCRDAIASLADNDLDQRPVSYRIAREFVRQRLVNARSSHGELLAHGVMVAPLTVMRPLPFRIVFIAGLGEGIFPSTERHSALDLRRAQPRASDVSPRDRDRYAFLETLLSTRDRLYLSWVARNQQSGEELEPSSVVQELMQILSTNYVDDVSALVTKHPLRRYDPAYFPDLSSGGEADMALAVNRSPSARKQARALALRRHLVDHLEQRELPIPSVQALHDELRGDHRDQLRTSLTMPAVAEASGDGGDDDEPVTISLSMLRRFLESPLQAWAAVVLGLRETAFDDLIAREDEPFITARLIEVDLLRSVFIDHLHQDGNANLMAEYVRRANRLGLTGNAPTGVFAELERQRHEAILVNWVDQMQRAGIDSADEWRLVAFGRARQDRTIDELLPPIRIDVPVGDRLVRVDLVGQTELQGVPGPGSVVLSPSERVSDKYMLRGVVDQLAQSAAGVNAGDSHGTSILTAGDKGGHYRFAAWTQDEARAHLSTLLADLLGGSHDYLMPCEAVFTAHDKNAASVTPLIDKLVRSSRPRFSCVYGPVTNLSGLAAPADADDIMERRFKPIFDRIQEYRGV